MLKRVSYPNKNQPMICERCDALGPILKNNKASSGWSMSAVSRRMKRDGNYQFACWCPLCSIWLDSKSAKNAFETIDTLTCTAKRLKK